MQNEVKNRSVVFTILWSFCASFLVARATSYLALLGTIPHIYPHLHGNHLHHFNYGILALILAGFLSITGSKISKNTQAIIYGIGLGLIMDEIGLLISLQNDYWTRQAFDALVITAALLINIEFFKDFWIKIFRKTTRGQSFHQIFPLKQKPTISVVIPAYNEEKSIVKTLESLKNQTYQGKVEIIVVDNNSTDNTAQIAEKLGAKVIFESQKGVAHARQAGFMAAKGDLIVTTDSDTILPLNWLSWYDNQFQKNPKAVMISGMYNFYDGSLILNFANWALNYFLFVIFSWYSGANMAVKRNAFKTVNGFDTTLPLSEDSDLGVRLRKYGKVLRFANFKVQTSARRFNSLGFFGGLWDYSYNYTIFKLHIKRSNVNFRSGSEVKELGRLPRLAIQLAVIAVVLFSLFGVMEVKPVKAAVVRNQHRIKNQMQKVDVDMIDVNWQQVKSFNHVSH